MCVKSIIRSILESEPTYLDTRPCQLYARPERQNSLTPCLLGHCAGLLYLGKQGSICVAFYFVTLKLNSHVSRMALGNAIRCTKCALAASCDVNACTQDEDIAAHFQPWGNVLDIYFPGKKGLKRVNYCFVTFDNWRAAQCACVHSPRAIGGRVLP